MAFWPFEEIWDTLAILNENNFERGPSKDHPKYWPCYCTVHVYVVIQFGDVCGLLEWKQICAGFLSFVIHVLPWKIQLSRGEDWDSSNRFNPTTSLCLSQAGTWISNVNMPLSFFVFSKLRCDKFGLNFSLVHRRLKCEELITPDTDDAFMWPLANWAKNYKKKLLTTIILLKIFSDKVIWGARYVSQECAWVNNCCFTMIASTWDSLMRW
jgi:hypothetical protein